MVVFMLIVIVLIGVAYADFCLVSNTAHFGICFQKLAEAEERRTGETLDAAVSVEEVEQVADVVPPAVFESESFGEEQVIAASEPRAGVGAGRTPSRPQRNPAPAWLLLDLEPVLELRE